LVQYSPTLLALPVWPGQGVHDPGGCGQTRPASSSPLLLLPELELEPPTVEELPLMPELLLVPELPLELETLVPELLLLVPELLPEAEPLPEAELPPSLAVELLQAGAAKRETSATVHSQGRSSRAMVHGISSDPAHRATNARVAG
jgi:hypothetical protein